MAEEFLSMGRQDMICTHLGKSNEFNVCKFHRCTPPQPFGALNSGIFETVAILLQPFADCHVALISASFSDGCCGAFPKG
jgi:hypothetical protein